MKIDLTKDIYFDPRLGQLYAKIQGGEYREYIFEHSLGIIQHQFIVRPIPLMHKGDIIWYDLTTPYGYGGPLILSCGEGDEEALIKRFDDNFSSYCRQNRIVSEFIRFHPLNHNTKYFSTMYDIQLYNHTVGTNLLDYEDPFMQEFSKTCRKVVRKCLNDGLESEIEIEPKSLSDFQNIYYQTMDRNKASEEYYFSSDYFQYLVDKMSEYIITCRVIYKGVTIAMGLYFKTADLLHAHLSGTKTEYLELSPAYVIKYAFLEWGLKNGIKLIHHGGGTTNDSEDSLFLFKKKFGKNTVFPFYLGKKIWNQDMYDFFVDQVQSKDKHFFPLYRDK
jgi:serine/alanine adding enzyme